MPGDEQISAHQNGDVAELKPIAGPTISGTATAPAYMMKRCCKPKATHSGNGGT